MGLVKTRRLAAMHPPSLKLRRTRKQQRAKAGMRPPVVKSGARKNGASFWSRDGYEAKRKDSR